MAGRDLALSLADRLSGRVDPGPSDPRRSLDRPGDAASVVRDHLGEPYPGLAGRGQTLFGGGLMIYLRLFWAFLRLGSRNGLAYRLNILVQLLRSGLTRGMARGGLAICFSQTDTLAGWQPAEMVGRGGVYSLIGGLINLVRRPS